MTTAREVEPESQELDRVTIRFAGDSGDGMQLTGTQFTRTAAVYGNDISTLPDFPAEIRAPAGSLPGVSGFQISFSSSDIHTPGDQPDVLVAMNPAALKTNVGDLPAGGALIVNSDAFTAQNLNKAGYASNPLTDGSLKQYSVFEIPISTLNERSLDGLDMTSKQKDLTKNFFALGIMFWLYGRDAAATVAWIDDKFGKRPVIAEANKRALKAGYAFGETTEIFHTHYRVAPAKLAPGTYRNITGNEATALGLLTASKLADRPLFYGSYPITPASDILHQLSGYKSFGVKTFQAEDEIAAIGAAIGASYGGALGLTASSGPGIALKSEALGLAVMVELPLVVVDVQRAGPSTGMPTKNEQADLLQVMFGRNSDSPLPVVAPATPGECFDMAIEAWRLALKYVTPVVYLSDAFLGTGAEPWKIPDVSDLPTIGVENATDPATFQPYARDPETLARMWAVPGTKGLEHRVGGLEKADITGNVSYDPDNHHRMQLLRAEKVARIANDIPDLQVYGPQSGELLILGW
ncbi:MAG TPA: 2-oxoacid:acceptor oxidoreductase subunit alpha, partial [Candidatus Limnocylindrales bacterium]|nr:2-oxoacid:acceptor oxidoreductase subunit alpha [Candidatus Limnocylindrales bacterium]